MNLWVITFFGVLVLGAVVYIITKKDGFAEDCVLLAVLIGIVWCMIHC